MWKAAKAASTAGFVLSLLPGASPRKGLMSALLGTAAGVASKFAIFHAGKATARDPHATFQLQLVTETGAVEA